MIYVAILKEARMAQEHGVLMTDWNQYRGLDLAKTKALMSGTVFVDLGNVYEPDIMAKHGFDYSCVGR